MVLLIIPGPGRDDTSLYVKRDARSYVEPLIDGRSARPVRFDRLFRYSRRFGVKRFTIQRRGGVVDRQ